MKTLIKTTFATLLTAIVLSTTASASQTSEPLKVKEVTNKTIKGINKIWVSGNVKLVLTQGEKEGVAGTEGYDEQTTSVQSKGQTLYINSTSGQRVTLNITVKDLQRIEAYGEAIVQTTNNFDVKYLQVFLNQNAKAKVNALAGSLYTVIKDNATLKMSGVAKEHTMIASNKKNVKLIDFVCLKNNQTPLTDSIKLAVLGR